MSMSVNEGDDTHDMELLQLSLQHCNTTQGEAGLDGGLVSTRWKLSQTVSQCIKHFRGAAKEHVHAK